MAKNTATESALGTLHEKVAKIMTNALDVMDEAQRRYLENDTVDQEVPTVSAPLLGVIAKFLSDNSITCAPEESVELTGLEQRLAEKRKRKTVGGVTHLEP